MSKTRGEVLFKGQFVWEDGSLFAAISDERGEGGLYPATILWDVPNRTRFEDFIRDKIGTRSGKLIFIPEAKEDA